ncbi:hypothetical protein AAULR_12532, partial [Lacticaseibacillus rhamnosus MTCC 5462]
TASTFTDNVFVTPFEKSMLSLPNAKVKAPSR